MKRQVNKTVKVDLNKIKSDPNFIVSLFQRKARQQGWTEEEIKTVLDEAESQDYNHLINTLILYYEPEDKFI